MKRVRDASCFLFTPTPFIYRVTQQEITIVCGSCEAKARLLEEPRVALVEAPSNERLQRTWHSFSDSIASVNDVAFGRRFLGPSAGHAAEAQC
jgi:hypothetical protein